MVTFPLDYTGCYPKAREWYVKEASEQMWSVRTLNRNIGTQYYGRRMACVREGLALPAPDVEANDPLEYIKKPGGCRVFRFSQG